MQRNLRMRVTARPYVGPSAFMPLINAGEVTMGLSSMGETNSSYLGLETEPMKDIRTVGRIVTMPFAFVVRKDSGINTIADLKGKRVVLDYARTRRLRGRGRGDCGRGLRRLLGRHRRDGDFARARGAAACGGE